MEPTTRIVIIGGGIAGLATALALKHHAQPVTLVERDPFPAEGDPQQAFDSWSRPGVPQFRHSHMLLSRLRTLIRDRHPDLLADLQAAGIHASTLDCMLPPEQAKDYVPAKGDDDLVHLWGRRATFEAVLFRHLVGLGHVRFLHGAKATGLTLVAADGQRRVSGVQLTRGASREVLPADVVIDASGGHSAILRSVRQQGIPIREDRSPSGFSYFCRHYRLVRPCDLPRRGTGGILEYLWFGTFFAEEGHFSIAIACPDEEHALAQALRRARGFDRVCDQLPALREWLARAEPVTPVLGAGKLHNHFRQFATSGSDQLLGLFCVGDSWIQTNPMYGRGCSSAFVQGQLLSEVLAAHGDPRQQARAYQRRARALLRPYYELAVTSDRLFLARARLARGESLSLSERILCAAYDRMLHPATLEDAVVGREMVRTMQMREVSPLASRLMLMLRIAGLTLTRRLRRVGDLNPRLGPPRNQLCVDLPEAPARSALQARR